MLRIGLVHYNTAEEVDRLLASLHELAEQPHSKRKTPPPVILSEAKNLALRIFSKTLRARFFASLRMTDNGLPPTNAGHCV